MTRRRGFNCTPGSAARLGLTLTGDGANVAVFSAHAQSIEFCLFDAAGETEVTRFALPGRTGDVFHGFVAGITAGARYGLRAHGPWAPHEGHRFNADKLLVDPYARALDRPFALHPTMFGHNDDGSRNAFDSGAHVPKAIARLPDAAHVASHPQVPWGATVVYELHVRGFTKLHPGVPASVRGTCAGLAHPAALGHLVRLGVTTVELMPVAAAVDEPHLARAGLTNYWGYNTVGWMVPDPRLAPGGIDELRACVAALHGAGIEVLLDVAFNHSGEGDANGPTLSLRGLDNATYYRTVPGAAGRYVDDSGCGNTLALDRPPVSRLVLDTLRYYATAAGVDGFRFDLATTLARRDGVFGESAPLLAAIAHDPLLRQLKMIAEPWDVGHEGYRLGAFPAPWGEWNDRYRDAVRRFWRGDQRLVGELATRVAGSADLFAVRDRLPSRSVNYITAHDGFTLTDLVSYEHKHNEANGEGNRDGTGANHSWNHGVEGASTTAAIADRRRSDVRALLATLLLSRGTPMLSMGDEFGRTQRGNNNTYAQDNPLSWLDWDHADRRLSAFVTALVALRRRHPALRDDRWLTGTPHSAGALPDVEWRRPDGHVMADGDWASGTIRTLVAALGTSGGGSPADRVVVAFHSATTEIALQLPAPRDGFAWHQSIDSSREVPALDPPEPSSGRQLRLAPRSVALWVEEAAREPRQPDATSTVFN